MKGFLTILLLLSITVNVIAQNLVLNPSLEFNTACPTATGQISNLISWFDLTSHTGTPDYFHTCATNADVTVPSNIYGTEIAATGSAYIGLFLADYSTMDYREYVEIELSTPLIAGQIYAVSFAYSLADNSNFSTADFGMHFSATTHIGTGTNTVMPLAPQITSSVVLSNKLGWTVVTENYIATGGEEYVLFGNFLDDAATTVGNLGNFGINGSYVYFDDFVIENICNYSLGNDTSICPGQTLLLDATAPNATYSWQDNSTGPTYNVTLPGTYWVEITDACGITIDSIVVSTVQPLNLNFGNDTTLCVGETWLLDATNSNSTYQWQNNSTSPTFTVAQQGIFSVEVSNGCETDSDTVAVNYLAGLIVNLGNDQVLCPGNITTLTATSPISTYLWQDNSTSSTYVVSQPGTYSVDVFSRCDTVSASVNISYFDPLNPIAGNDTVICQGDSLIIDVTSPNGSYLWQDNSTDPTFTIYQEGTYWVDIINDCGTGSDTLTVSYLENLNINLGNDTVLCEGADLNLNLPFTNVNYLWQNSATNSSQIISNPGLYFVDVGVPGCSVSDSINISYQFLDVAFDYQNTVSGCPKINTVSFTDQSTVNFGSIDSYQWIFNNGTSSINASPVNIYDIYGTYDVGLQVTSNSGCVELLESDVVIDYYDEIDGEFGISPKKGVANETMISFSNLSNNSTDWIWDFGDGNFSTEENPAHTYTDAGTYTVTLIAGNDVDCSDTISRTVIIYEQVRIFVPNAFTPGYGGPNNSWSFSILGVDIYNFTMLVYNRWGELMWESHDPTASWNGEYNGELVLPGTYVWKMEINNPTLDKRDTFFGSVNVLR